MENNIDKDIEKVKDFLNGKKMQYGEKGYKNNNNFMAIENVLSELEKEKETTNDLREWNDFYKKEDIKIKEKIRDILETDENIENEKALIKIKSELETYKKIVDEKNKELNEENLRCSKLAVENNDLKEKLEISEKIAEKIEKMFGEECSKLGDYVKDNSTPEKERIAGGIYILNKLRKEIKK